MCTVRKTDTMFSIQMLEQANASYETCQVTNAKEILRGLSVDSFALRKLNRSQCICIPEIIRDCSYLNGIKVCWTNRATQRSVSMSNGF